MQTAEDINTINKEEAGIRAELKKQKNRVLKMTNIKKRQEAWSALFPKRTQDDSYLAFNIF
jgi:hypothetical protein